MLLTLSYTPGQTATVFLETLDGYGQRADGYTIPVITRIVYPDLSLASGYPADMTQLDVGLYYYQFVLPSGAISIGSYLVDIAYTNPSTGYTNTELYQVMVSAPFGNFGLTPGYLGGRHEEHEHEHHYQPPPHHIHPEPEHCEPRHEPHRLFEHNQEYEHPPNHRGKYRGDR